MSRSRAQQRYNPYNISIKALTSFFLTAGHSVSHAFDQLTQPVCLPLLDIAVENQLSFCIFRRKRELRLPIQRPPPHSWVAMGGCRGVAVRLLRCSEWFKHVAMRFLKSRNQ